LLERDKGIIAASGCADRKGELAVRGSASGRDFKDVKETPTTCLSGRGWRVITLQHANHAGMQE
jgi:hypothetical protein